MFITHYEWTNADPANITAPSTLGRLRNDSHVEESLRGVVKVMCTGTARSNDIHNAE
jgi:hypothetical protein